MEITTRYIGDKIVEITIEAHGTKMTVDVCDLNGVADIEFINSLKGVAEELEDHNEGLTQ